MTIDLDTILYDAVYPIFGVSAMLVPAGSGVGVTLTVIDKTSGIGPGVWMGIVSGVQVDSLKPAATVRRHELISNGVSLEDLYEADLVFNGGTWKIKSHMVKAGPQGENHGEVLLLLVQDDR